MARRWWILNRIYRLPGALPDAAASYAQQAPMAEMREFYLR